MGRSASTTGPSLWKKWMEPQWKSDCEDDREGREETAHRPDEYPTVPLRARAEPASLPVPPCAQSCAHLRPGTLPDNMGRGASENPQAKERFKQARVCTNRCKPRHGPS